MISRQWDVGDLCVFVNGCEFGDTLSGRRCVVKEVGYGVDEYFVEFDNGEELVVFEGELKPLPGLEAMKESVDDGEME